MERVTRQPLYEDGPADVWDLLPIRLGVVDAVRERAGLGAEAADLLAYEELHASRPSR